MMDMATRSWSPAIRQLLVDLLNENNAEVQEAHESNKGQKIMKDAAGPMYEETSIHSK